MGKNAYSEKRELEIMAYRQAEKDTYIQYMVDMFMIVLNEPEVMGKDVFGKQRLAKVINAVSKTFDDYAVALTTEKEADYFRSKLDERIMAIVGEEEFVPFPRRYEWIKQIKYRPKKK